MRGHTSLAGLVRASTLAMAVAATFCACKKQPLDKAPSLDADVAPHAELPPGVLMQYGGGGGITGKSTQTTVFADGRLERTVSGRPAPPANVPVPRVEKLAADLASTGVFAEKDGTWAPSRPVPDGVGADLAVRDQAGAVHTYHWSTGATAPTVVEHALTVAAAFASEVEPPAPRCGCQAGDPLCVCP